MRVRHVPGTGGWHPATDNLDGTNEVYGDMNDDSEPWSIKFNHFQFSEIMFTFGDHSKWMIMSKEAVYEEYDRISVNILQSSFS